MHRIGCSSWVGVVNGTIEVCFSIANPHLADGDLDYILPRLTLLDRRTPINQIDLRGGSFSMKGCDSVQDAMPNADVVFPKP